MSVARLRVQHRAVDGPSSSQAGGTGQEAIKFGSASLLKSMITGALCTLLHTCILIVSS